MVAIESQVHTKLKNWGTSRGVRIPKRFCEYLFIAAGADLTMTAGQDDKGRFITLRVPEGGHRSFSSVPMTSMDAAFEGYSGGYVPTEADWGCDVGAEIVQ